MMKCNLSGLRIIEEFEGLRIRAYRCPRGRLTVGYGHTGLDVTEGMVVSPAQALELLRRDVATAEEAVSRLVKVPLSENQFSALVSFVFNVGEGTFASHDLLRFLNAGDYERAARELPLWVHCGGKVEPGLVKRRAAEWALFLTA